jgi:hypothetical protein
VHEFGLYTSHESAAVVGVMSTNIATAAHTNRTDERDRVTPDCFRVICRAGKGPRRGGGGGGKEESRECKDLVCKDLFWQRCVKGDAMGREVVSGVGWSTPV